MAGAHERLDAGGKVPPRPDTDPRSWVLSIAALGLTVVASAMTLPAFVGSLDWSGMPGDPNAPEDWTVAPWGWAFIVGSASFALGIIALDRQRRGGSESGRWLARCAVGLSVLGALAWTYVLLLAANASM